MNWPATKVYSLLYEKRERNPTRRYALYYFNFAEATGNAARNSCSRDVRGSFDVFRELTRN